MGNVWATWTSTTEKHRHFRLVSQLFLHNHGGSGMMKNTLIGALFRPEVDNVELCRRLVELLVAEVSVVHAWNARAALIGCCMRCSVGIE